MSCVLIDTSAWIDFFRDATSPYGKIVDCLLEDDLACTCNLVIAELVQAAPSRREYEEMLNSLRALPMLSDPPDVWGRVMENGFLLRRKGVNGVGIPDLMVAAIAGFHDIPVFSKDHHFSAMRDHLGLSLFEPKQRFSVFGAHQARP